MWRNLSSVLALGLLAMACTTSDSGGTPAACPAGSLAMDLFQCVCEGAPNGLTQCQTDGTLTGCDCGADAMAYAAMLNNPTPPADAPATPPVLTPPADTPAVPPPAAPPATPPGDDEDGGVPGGDGDGDMVPGDGDGDMVPGDGDGDMTPPASAGGQLAPCTKATDCNMNFDCYTQGPSGGVCSKVCAADGDCATIAGGDYTCYLPGGGGGVCRVTCTGATDTCPDTLTCREVDVSAWRCVP